MSKTITTTVSVQLTGDGLNELRQYQVTDPAGTNPTYNPAATGNVSYGFGIFSAGIGFLVVPPASSGFQKTLKGVGGDTGVPISRNRPLLLFTPGGSTFIVALFSNVEPQWGKIL